MNKASIKTYAIWARNELITRVSQKAYEYGVEKDNIVSSDADSINGKLLSSDEKNKRRILISQVNQKGYDQVMEEAAYTWFNRFIALRFMEVNNYLPNKVRLFTNEKNEFNPQILEEALHIDLLGLDKNKVIALKETNNNEELYKALLLATCNDISQYLPGMFKPIDDYMTLLFPSNLLRDESVLGRLITDIDEDSWTDQVQIIGWLYQYYNTEPKDKVFNSFKKNIKVKKEGIPAATQLFTPDWIVRYMTENSLGRLWLDGHPNISIKSNWKYYLDEAEQEESVQIELNKIKAEHAQLKPEDIKFLDPCMGSGHILVYAFDVFMQIYVSEGWTEREAAKSILQNNLFGLDIDERAYQLSYFALMMKARQYNRRILTEGIVPNVLAIEESNIFNKDLLRRFGDLKPLAERVINIFIDAKEYGSILNVEFTNEEISALENRLNEIHEVSSYENLVDQTESDQLFYDFYPLLKQARTMSQKYDCVVTNPPYMSNRNIGKNTANYISKKYSDSKNDLFAVFIEVASQHLIENGFYAMITQPSIISLSAFKKLRYSIIKDESIVSLIHMGRGIFGIDFGSTAFIIQKKHPSSQKTPFFKLFEKTFQYIAPEDIEQIYLNAKNNHVYKFDFSSYNRTIPSDFESSNDDVAIEDELNSKNNHIYYELQQSEFLKIPDNPFSYWMAPELIDSFNSTRVEDFANVTNGLFTCDNNRFLRLWFEVSLDNTNYDCDSKENNLKDTRIWYPYNKGGNYRKWYGNHDYVVRFDNFGKDISEFRVKSGQSASFPGQAYYFKESLSWSFISAGKFGIRYYPKGFVFDIAGSSVFPRDSNHLYQMLAFLGSEVATYALQIINPTMNYQAGNVRQLPLFKDLLIDNSLEILARNNVELAKADWDSFETSWNFKRHPLLRKQRYISDTYILWATECNSRFDQTTNNEIEINNIVISRFRLNKTINGHVEDKDISIRKADLQREIRSLISYAVGCMFGRYSLDVDGLAYAGGEWDDSKYKTFIPDKDNIIPICDDEYFEDDIVGRFIDFIKAAYGEDTLEENLQFIADALGGKGTSREIIRNYFINDFYKDHVKIYQKRPIYWQFDSGKKNGFKALVYIHRYTPDLIARMRTSYVHEQQSRYENQISMIQNRIDNAGSTSERVKAEKELKKLREQAEELRGYEGKVHHWADKMEPMDLDDGVKANYAKFQELLTKIK